MKLKPSLSFILNRSSTAFSGGLVRALIHSGRFVGDAAGTGVGMGIKMSVGMVLASLVPQVSLAQDDLTYSRQPIKHSRKVELSYKSEDKAPKVNVAAAPQAVNFAKTALGRVEVVDAVPKLNEKYLSTEELRLLRKQLLEQR